ncbi:flavin reductase family protein [Flavobacterium antarcticum]|uniref:flavin reductase family protein n=1 Tax=Flavobacterium antarcticum TaxID=271155 RepID=UPI0003B36409|nr:flavin reductase [Flavobacterium antarcticum]
MKEFDSSTIEAMAKVPRLNLINSVTGYKSANLIGTISSDNILNIAIFSSVTHLGSNPPMLGFMIRPMPTAPKDTYKNIKEQHYFTVNSITSSMVTDAHHTSANYPPERSEFESTNLIPEFLDDLKVPFVKGSPVRLLCKYLNEYEIVENGCIHLIASIKKVYVEDELMQDDFSVRLDLSEIVTINGIDGYALPQLINRFGYAHPDQPTKSIL